MSDAGFLNHREALTAMFDGAIVACHAPMFLRHHKPAVKLIGPVFRWNETRQVIEWDQYRSDDWKECQRAFWFCSYNFLIESEWPE